MKYTVRFSARFRTTVSLPTDIVLVSSPAVSDIDIPEDHSTKYVEDSFDPEVKSANAEVEFEACFVSDITVEDGECLSDAVCDVNIPENNECKYVENSFDVISVTNEDGMDVDWESDEDE